MPILTLLVGGLLAETWLLIEIGGHIGGLATIGICVLTGFIGGSLARLQGMALLRRAMQQVNRGEMPTKDMVDGVFILIAGVVLLTPGYLSDTLGFLLLTPPVRAMLRPRALRWAKGKIHVAANNPRGSWVQGGFGQQPFADMDIERPHPDDSAQPLQPVELLPPDSTPKPPSKRRGPVTIIDQ